MHAIKRTDDAHINGAEELHRRLKDAEKLCQTLIQTSLYGIQEIDLYGNIIYTNSVLCEILGYSGGELKGKQVWQLLASDADRERLKEHLTKLAHGEPAPHLWIGRYIKKRKKRKNREIVELQQNWRYRQNDQGRITGFISLTTDVINYKQAQRGGAEGEEERYRLIVEALREMAITFDMHGRITYVNEKATETLGYFEEEFLAMNIEDILPPLQLEKIQETLLAKHKAGNRDISFYDLEFIDRNLRSLPIRLSTSLILKDNEPSDILFTAHELKHEKGIGCEAVPIGKDTTGPSSDMKGRNEDICRLIAENAKEMILSFDTEGIITYVNQSGEELIGYLPEELLDMNIADILPPEHLEKLKQRHFSGNTAGDKESVISEVEFINRELNLVAIEISSSLIINDGKPSGILIIARDMARQRKKEKEILRFEKFESLATLAGGFADDLNNLLTGVMGNIELAQMGLDPDGKPHKILSYAKKSCANIKNLARQFVIFSKRGTITRKTGSLTPIIKNSTNEAAKGFDVRCKFFISKDLWPVPFDEKQMKQVIHHLVINAAESLSPNGQIKVYAENVSISDNSKNTPLNMRNGDYVKISVQDKGAGIRDEFLGKIFDPYFSTKNIGEQKGRGLGLAVVYAVIKKHYGYIDVDSKPGRITTFDVYLPVSRKVTPKKGVRKKRKKHILTRGKVLIMDDEEIVTDVAGQMLNELGYDVAISKNGDEAVKMYEKAMNAREPFDVVILDLHVEKGMGGKETMKKLLKIDPYVRGVASSGYSNDPEMTDFDKYGFSSAVEKPYSISELSHTLEEIMEEYETIEVHKSDWLAEK